MTLRELARLANVSVSTASKAFSGAADIGEDTRERVLQLAKETGCYGKFFKGARVKPVYAIICPELGSAYYNGFIEILQTRIEAQDGIVLISADHFDSARQAELLEYYAACRKADGIIVFDLSVPLKKGYETPVIAIGGIADPMADRIALDFEPPIRQAITSLKEKGHRSIAFLGETLTQKKMSIFIRCMENAGIPLLPEQLVIRTERFEEAGIAGVRQLLQNNIPFTALICAYDYIAFGAMRQLSASGLHVPEDISVIGMDNIRISGYLDHSLTTIDTHIPELCEIIYSLLEKKRKNPYFRIRQQITVAGDLIVRDSIRNAKK